MSYHLIVLILALSAGVATLFGAILGQEAKSKLGLVFGCSFAGMMMLLISLFELIPEGYSELGLVETVLSVLGGIIFIILLDLIVPHVHVSKNNHSLKMASRSFLILLGLLLHDFPEGVTMASSFSYSQNLGIIVFLSMFIHNIPEGYALSVLPGSTKSFLNRNALLSAGSTLSGALVGLILSSFQTFNNYMIVFVAGVMIYVSIHELIPLALKNKQYSQFAFGSLLSLVTFFVLHLL
jgi:ZIP family zinc transporter